MTCDRVCLPVAAVMAEVVIESASIDTILDASVVFIFRPPLGISRETVLFTLWSSPSFSVSFSNRHLLFPIKMSPFQCVINFR
jgi:hypothetical protein